MLTHVTIKNFRCLRDVSVGLKPLTVLLGPNDSGKSSFLAGVRVLGGETGFELPRDAWRLGAGPIMVHGDIDGYRITASNRSDVDNRHHIGKLQPTRHYQLPITGILTTCVGVPDSSAAPELDREGSQTAALLDYLYRLDRERFDTIAAAARTLIPGAEKIVIAHPTRDTRRIDLQIDGGFRVPCEFTSVGVRLVVFFLALAYHPTPPKIVLIEEPENGMHPRRMADVMRLLREITVGKHGNNAAQVILTTHSPYLLDNVDLKTDQVLVFRRNDDGSRSAEPADAERLKTFLDEFMLGEVWYNVGEEGLVRKQ